MGCCCTSDTPLNYNSFALDREDNDATFAKLGIYKQDSVTTIHNTDLVRSDVTTTYGRTQNSRSNPGSEVNKSFESCEDSIHSVNNLGDDLPLNFHEYSVNIFNIVTNIRSKPQNYIVKVRELLSKLKHTLDGKVFIETDNCTYYFKSREDSIISLEQFLLKLTSKNIVKNNMELRWSEGMFQTINEYLNLDEKDLDFLNPKLRQICNKQTEYLKISNDGLMNEETKVLLMLLENEDIREDFFSKVFSIGASCSSFVNNEMKVRTILVLANYMVGYNFNKTKNKDVNE